MKANIRIKKVGNGHEVAVCVQRKSYARPIFWTALLFTLGIMIGNVMMMAGPLK